MDETTPISVETVQNEETFFEKVAFRAAKNLGSATSLIIHTFLFIGIFSLHWFAFSVDQILLILTTIVSLEAIYMSIFIQMTVNRHSEGLIAVQEDIEDIQEDVEEISEDIDGIQAEVKEIGEDVEDIQEDVEEISEDIDGIQAEVKEIGEGVDDIQEDVEDLSEEIDEDEDDKNHKDTLNQKLHTIEQTLQRLLSDIESLKK